MKFFAQIVFFSHDSDNLNAIYILHKDAMVAIWVAVIGLLILSVSLLVMLAVYQHRLRRRKHEFELRTEQMKAEAAEMAREERDASWRTMARQIAHEINNPLTPMQLRIQQLQRLHKDDDPRFDAYFRESAPLFLTLIDDLSRIATNFSTFAKRPRVEPAKVDVAQRLSGVITLFRSNEQDIPIRYVGADSGVFAIADPEQIQEVFVNIIKNALQAIENAKPHIENADIMVTMTGVANEDGMLEISISDNGPGIPEDIRDKVFVPNFTTKSTGAGLGLAICKNIVEGCGGEIRFLTGPRGTTFFILLKAS